MAHWLDSLKTRLWELNKDNERVEVSHMNKLEVVLREINGQIIRNRCHDSDVGMDYFFFSLYYLLPTIVPFLYHPFVLNPDYRLFTHTC